MLSTRSVFDYEGLRIADIACRHGRGPGAAEETDGYGIGFVRRGCFARSAEGGRALLDPSSLFFVNPNGEHRYDHPHTGGDDCTAFLLDAELLASIWGGDLRLPAGAAHSSPELDLAHRQLLADAERTDDAEEIFERAVLLLTATLEGSDRVRVGSGRPATERARRRLVEQAREALAADHGHLCRVLREETGSTPSALRAALGPETRLAG